MKKFPKPWFRPSRGTWFVTLDGKQINLGGDERLAFEQYKQLLARPASAKPVVVGDVLVAIVDAFLDWTSHHRSADTYEWYRYRLQRFCERYPDLRTRDLRPFHVQQWVDGYAGFSRTTKRNYVRSVKRCLKWAVQQGYLERNPIEQLEVPGADRRETIVTPDEFETLLGHVRDDAFRDLLVVSWETGCRPQESLRVEARHVDLARRRWVFPQQESKGRRAPRIVYLTEASLEITRRLVAAYPTGPLLRNANGDPWTTDAVNCAFDRVQVRMAKIAMSARGIDVNDEEVASFVGTLSTTRRSNGRVIEKTKAELREEARRKLRARKAKEFAPRCSLYALRHSWATRALQSGLDGLTVAILMGHSDPSTLARVYQHLSHQPEHLQKQLERVGS